MGANTPVIFADLFNFQFLRLWSGLHHMPLGWHHFHPKYLLPKHAKQLTPAPNSAKFPGLDHIIATDFPRKRWPQPELGRPVCFPMRRCPQLTHRPSLDMFNLLSVCRHHASFHAGVRHTILSYPHSCYVSSPSLPRGSCGRVPAGNPHLDPQLV